jgi:hypothetical protein
MAGETAMSKSIKELAVGHLRAQEIIEAAVAFLEGEKARAYDWAEFQARAPRMHRKSDLSITELHRKRLADLDLAVRVLQESE